MKKKPIRTFTSFNELFNYTDSLINKCLEEVALKYQENLKKYIKKNFYDKHNPTNYIRSEKGSFLESLVVEIKRNKRNNYECYIYCDPSLMTITIYEDSNVWNTHADVYGNDVRDGIPIWINTGNGDSPLYQYSGCGWVNYLNNMIQLHLKTDMKLTLRKHGITSI